MARANKYASINFNEVYGPKKQSISSSSPSSSVSSAQNGSLTSIKPHGRMLVLTIPTPKPLTTTSPSEKKASSTLLNKEYADQIQTELKSISLGPLGHSDPFSPKEEKELTNRQPVKPEPFVPPHMRPGFVGREMKFEAETFGDQRGQRRNFQNRHDQRRSVGDYERPRSVGYESGRKGTGRQDFELNRPRSNGNRSSSGGCYSSSRNHNS